MTSKANNPGPLSNSLTEGVEKPKQTVLPTPFSVLVIMVLTIFTVEGLVMALLHYTPKLSPTTEALVYASLISLFSFPVVFYFIYKPMAFYIAEHKRAEGSIRTSEEQYRCVAETGQDGIITLDEASRIIFANPAIENIFGYTTDELLNRRITMLIVERLRVSHLSSFEAYLQSSGKHANLEGIELIGLRKNQKEIPLEISFGEYAGHGKRAFTAVVRDITQRKRVMEELRMAKEKAEEANKLKDKFVSLISNDLRAPFNSILGLLRLLESDPGRLLGESKMEKVRRVLAVGENMLEMIEELLDLSRLQTGHITPQPFFMDGHSIAVTAISRLKMDMRLWKKCPAPILT